METCDALIIGGGPAGSACAGRLRRHGLDVLVMDKAAFPRDKVCAGWITPAVLRTLQLDALDYAKDRVLQPISAFRTGLIDRNAVETRYPTPVSYGIRRSEFDDYLLRRSGARLHLGQPVQSIQRRDNGWIVNDAILSPLLIGAGGHFCPVARLLGAKPGITERAVAAKEVEFEMDHEQRADCLVASDTPELYFLPDLKGYGWCLRKGNHLNIGLGREAAHRLPEELLRFCNFLKRHGRIPQRIPERFHGHAYLLYGHAPRRLLDDGVMLIGDAAGLAYPQSGEGIRPAIESGLMAADCIIDATGDYRTQTLAGYPQRLAARFGSPAQRLAAVDRPQPVLHALARAVLGNRWSTRHLLLNRWFLHTHQAPLPSG